jgi:hypothetical protein
MTPAPTAPPLLVRDQPHADGYLWEVVWPRPKGPWPVRLRHGASGALAFGIYDPQTDALQRVRPEEDEALPPLRDLLQAGRLIAYRPGRRATVRLGDGGKARYAKVFRPARARAPRERIRAVTAALKGRPAPGIPEMVEADLTAGVLVFRGAPGLSLHDRLMGGPGVSLSILEAVAGSLARLHEFPGRSLPDGDVPIGLGVYVRLASKAFPEEAGHLRATLQEVVALPRPASTSDRLVHGDLHDRNVLLDGERVTLLDLDLAHAGDPAEDVGNLASHLVLRALQAGRGLAAGRRDADRLVRSYRGAGGSIEDPSVRRVGARTLLRLACLYRFRRPWRHLSPVLAQEAARWATAGRP